MDLLRILRCAGIKALTYDVFLIHAHDSLFAEFLLRRYFRVNFLSCSKTTPRASIPELRMSCSCIKDVFFPSYGCAVPVALMYSSHLMDVLMAVLFPSSECLISVSS